MAELALGIIPMVALAIKSHVVAHEKVTIYRTYSKSVDRLYRRLRSQRRVFKEACGDILNLVLDDEVLIGEMTKNPDHSQWKCRELEDLLVVKLGDDYYEWTETVKEIQEGIEQMAEALAGFNIPARQREEAKHCEIASKRIRDALKLAFKKTDYEKWLEELSESNRDLKSLRKRATNFEEPNRRLRGKQICRGRQSWDEFCAIRQGFRAIHDILLKQWSCKQASHARHSVNLFMEAQKLGEEVQIDLAILFSKCARNGLETSIVQLRVRSRILQRMVAPLPTPSPSNASEQSSGPPTKRRKVIRFADEESGGDTSKFSQGLSQPSATGYPTVSCNILDLRSSADICSDLTRRCVRPSASAVGCLGHIDVDLREAIRCSFFPTNVDICGRPCHSMVDAADIIALDQILDQSVKSYLSMADKCRLALTLVLAVLNFHSVPRLNREWSLQDLSFFRRSDDLASSLRTIHVTIEDLGKPYSGVDTKLINTPMEGVELTQNSFEAARTSQSVTHNATLRSLGVALFEIDRWSAIKPDEAPNIRDMVDHRRSSFGKNYKKFVGQCLDGRFSCGSTDLSSSLLQRDIFDDMVENLRKTIESLDI